MGCFLVNLKLSGSGHMPPVEFKTQQEPTFDDLQKAVLEKQIPYPTTLRHPRPNEKLGILWDQRTREPYSLEQLQRTLREVDFTHLVFESSGNTGHIWEHKEVYLRAEIEITRPN